MNYDDAPESYRRAYDRLETEVITVVENTTTQCQPAVFTFPADADISAQAVHEAVSTDDAVPIDPYTEETETGFYYVSGRIYRTEAEPDITIRADANTLRLFENPYDAEEPLPELSFKEFAAIIDRIETALEVTFLPYEEDDE